MEIPAELFQILKDDAVKVLHSICQQIWKTQQWPQNWKMLVFIPIQKTDNAKECSNYCTVALISHASKVMLKILQARLQQYVNWKLSDIQAGFKKCRDQRSNCQHSLDHIRSKGIPNTSASLTMLKPLTVLVRFSHSEMSNSLWPHELQHSRLHLPMTNSWSLLKLMSIESVMPSNHLILCCPRLLLPSIFPSIRVFSNESAVPISWSKFRSFSFNTSPSSEYPGLISFWIDW